MHVQQELNKRQIEKANRFSPSKHHPLFGKVICGCCGSKYVRRTLIGKGSFYQKAWKCQDRLKGSAGNGCMNRIVWEEELLQYIDCTIIVVYQEKFGFSDPFTHNGT